MSIEILPFDEHNQKLVSHVRPDSWVNPRAEGRYNLVVIGGGTAGLVCAMGAAGLGARVALIERHLLGGDCLNFGCVPSKGILAAAHAAQRIRDAERFGISVEGQHIDFGRAMEWVRRTRASIAPHDSAQRFKEAGIDVFLGEGRFVEPRVIEVDGERLSFGKAVVATGGHAFVPPIAGLDSVNHLTNETIFSLEQRPEHLIVVGAGPIGCELAQAFRRLGSEVTLLDMSERVLPKDDAKAAKLIQQRFLEEGIRLVLSAKLERVESTEQGVRVWLEAGSPKELSGSHLLLAAGRRPNVAGMGLEAAGVEFDEKQGVRVDRRLRTTNKHVFAAGDVAGHFQFTHAADAMARMVLKNAFFFGRSKVDSLVVPWATYTDPEVAHIGISAADAEAQGAGVVEVELSSMDRAIVEGTTTGFAKAFHDKKGRILGATVVAENAGDLIGELSLAMTGKLSLGTISAAIHPYPTQGEIIKRLGDAYMRTRLTPTVAGLFERWFRWLR